MNETTLTDIRRLSVAQINDLVPLVLTANGEPVFIIEKLENVIALSDLHINVRHQLRAQEQKARVGLPSPLHVYARDRAHPEILPIEKPEPPKVIPEIAFVEKLIGRPVSPEFKAKIEASE